MELEKSQKPCRKSQERRKQFERKQNSDKFLINPNMTGNIEYEKGLLQKQTHNLHLLLFNNLIRNKFLLVSILFFKKF